MQKIIYIYGLGHSGSTILDLSLGCHPSIIGLGELSNLLMAKGEVLLSDDFNATICSCGNNIGSCDFWAGMKDKLVKYSDEKVEDKYQILINFFIEKYGGDKILVDSSKEKQEYLPFLNERFELYVIFLIRDFRSWTYSRHCRHGRNMIGLAYEWVVRNVKRKNYLIRENMNFMIVGYEELSLFPEFILKKICEFIGIEYDPIMLQPNLTKSHVAKGNVVRGDNVKRKAFIYDARWFTSFKLNLLGPLFIPIIIWNNKHVYSNFIQGKTKAYGISQRDFILFGDKKKDDLARKLKEYKYLSSRRKL